MKQEIPNSITSEKFILKLIALYVSMRYVLLLVWEVGRSKLKCGINGIQYSTLQHLRAKNYVTFSKVW